MRAGWGAALVLRPRGVLARAGSPASRPAVLAVRALGLRQLAQAAWLHEQPGDRQPIASELVDGLHAASMAILALIRRDHRRAALASLGVSLVLLAWAAAEARRG